MNTKSTGIHIEGERVLVKFRNDFDKILQRTLGFCTPGGQVEYRHRDNAVTMGKLVEIEGRQYIIFPVRR